MVIAHDYLTQRGGAERVVLAMCGAFRQAPVLTSVFHPAATFEEFSRADVRTTALQKIPLLARHHRLGLPAYASAFNAVTVDAPLTICSTSGWAHGVRVTGSKALYVHNTARWIYQLDEYTGRGFRPRRALAAGLSKSLRRWDLRAAASADKIWVNSRVVQERVWRHWSLDSEVLHPPHGADAKGPKEAVPGLDPGYLLVVARLLPYKRVGVVTEAMRYLPDERLVVVGEGPESNRLRLSAPANCRFLGVVSDQQLRWLYANCIGLVSAAHEDFGLAPLEAMAFGQPVAVLRSGGFIETVRDGETGTFFDNATPRDAARAIGTMISSKWSRRQIEAWADSFSVSAFSARIRAGARELVGDLATTA